MGCGSSKNTQVKQPANSKKPTGNAPQPENDQKFEGVGAASSNQSNEENTNKVVDSNPQKAEENNTNVAKADDTTKVQNIAKPAEQEPVKAVVPPKSDENKPKEDKKKKEEVFYRFILEYLSN